MSAELPIELQNNILALQNAVQKRLPDMPNLLSKIHKALKADPDNVTLLSEEQVAILFNGLEMQTGAYIATTLSKSKSLTKKLKETGLDDI